MLPATVVLLVALVCVQCTCGYHASHPYSGYRTQPQRGGVATPYHHRHRHSRFPRLDGFIARIHDDNNVDLTTTTMRAPVTTRRMWAYRRYPSTTTTTVASPKYDALRRSPRMRVKSLERYSGAVSGRRRVEDLDDYEEDNSNTNINDYDDLSANPESDNNEDEDNDGDEDELDAWQAEESTTEAPQNKVSTLTEAKWTYYGTRESVTKSRNNWLQNQSRSYEVAQQQMREAIAHANRMWRGEGACRVPRPRVVSVQTFYPDPAVTYVPHCTLLHRCGDDAGCCSRSDATCAPNATERVFLHFTVSHLSQSTTVERLAFENHTLCECVNKEEWQRRVEAGTATPDPITAETTPGNSGAMNRRDVPQARHPFMPSPAPEPLKKCRCPSLYLPDLELGECHCVCDAKNSGCIHMNRGREYFSFADRLCIQNGTCSYPGCEFGSYLFAQGRCPKKKEKFASFARYRKPRY